MVSLSGSMWVEMKAREVKMVAAHSNESLTIVSRLRQKADVSVYREPYMWRSVLLAHKSTTRLQCLSCGRGSADFIVHARHDTDCAESHSLKDLQVDLVSKRHSKLFHNSHSIFALVLQFSLSFFGRRR